MTRLGMRGRDDDGDDGSFPLVTERVKEDFRERGELEDPGFREE